MAFKDVVMSRPVSVVVPVMSSMAGALRRYIMSVLPAGYVRDYFIDTEIPLTRFLTGRRKFRPMHHSQLEKRKLPLLSIRVEPTADPSDFATGTTFWTSTRFLDDPTRLAKLLYDDDNLRYAGYETERMVLRFQVSFTVETELRASELMMYLRRTVPTGQRVYLNDIDVATEIPTDLLRAIWGDMKLGAGTPENMNIFREYMSATTAGLVEQQVNSASGRLTFAFSYRANPLVSVGAVSMTVNREGNVVNNAQIDIPFDIDVMVPVAYAYRQEESLGPPVDIGDNPFSVGEENGNAYFSAAIRTRPPLTIDNGLYQLAFFTAIVTGPLDPSNVEAPDESDFSPFINERIRRYITALVAANPDDTPVGARLWLGGDEVDANTWDFDTDTWKLEIRRPVQRNQKYHFGLYADMTQLDALAPEIRRPQATKPMFKKPTA